LFGNTVCQECNNSQYGNLRTAKKNIQFTTSGYSKVNLTTGRIAAAHRLFNGIRKVAPLCSPT